MNIHKITKQNKGEDSTYITCADNRNNKFAVL